MQVQDILSPLPCKKGDPGQNDWPEKLLKGVKKKLSGLLATSLCVASCVMWTLPAHAGAKDFSFTLPSARKTSAGVYASDGTLIRTLWSNKSFPAGTNTAVWDGLDDARQPVAGGNYQIKVLHSDVSYSWQGTIGNSSTNQTGPTVHRSYAQIQGMAIKGNDMFIVQGFNEGQSLWNRTNISDPNIVTARGGVDHSRTFSFVATDGTYTYYANVGNSWIGSRPSFIVASKVSDNSMVTFSSGVNENYDPQKPTWNAIDRETGDANIPTGLAVQSGSPYLFVSHAGLNQLRVINKTTGAFVRSVTMTAPGPIAVTPDNHLWVICTENGNRVVRRYQVDSAGNLTAASVVTGLTLPLAVAVSPDSSTLLVADGGSSQQVKAFSNVSSGTPSSLWTLGQSGGYDATNGPTVSNTKFHFVNIAENGFGKTFLAFQSDGSFWVGDPGNQRHLRFSASRTYQNQIAFLECNYTSTVCVGDPTRVFALGWLEFAVPTYSSAAKNDWTLVKNWAAGLPSSFTSFSNVRDIGGLSVVIKLSNNRTYATAYNSANSKKEVLELTTTGARLTGIVLDDGWSLHEDGSLRKNEINSFKQTFYRRTLSGFDGSGNPQWNAQTILASTPQTATDPDGSSGARGFSGPRFPSTSTGLVLASDGQSNRQGQKFVYHLGALNAGGTKWLWRAAPSGRYFNANGVVGNGEYPVNNSFALDRHIILGCHGEFYTAPTNVTGQANQFMHFLDNGLQIGQFGTELSDVDRGIPYSEGVVAKAAGNAYSPSFVKVGSDYYVWHNDESGTGGVHRWKINNPSSVTEITSTIALPSTGGNGTGLTAQYFAGKNLDTLKLTRVDPQVNFTWTGSPDTASGTPADNFSVRWSGLVQPLYSQSYTFYTQSDDGVRLWVNGQKIIDNWTDHGSTENTSTTVALNAGQKYSIVMELYDSGYDSVAQLKWSSSSQTKQIIPFSQLYPSDAIAINCGGPAVGRFQADPYDYSDPSWVKTTSNSIDTSGWNDPAPMSVYQDSRVAYHTYTFSNLAPVTNYKVRLHLAEVEPSKFSVGSRVFGVIPNKMGFISPDIDPYAAGGGYNYRAAIREFVVTSERSGVIDLSFEYRPHWPAVAGIEIVRDASEAADNPQFAIIGAGKGLKGQYYTGTNFNTLVQTRLDPEVNFEWTGLNPVPSVGPNGFTARWTGQVQTLGASGNYTFIVQADEGCRLWIDNVLVIDKWSSTTPGWHEAVVNLAGSTKHDVKLEYLQNTGQSYVKFEWKHPNGYLERIPPSQLHPAP